MDRIYRVEQVIEGHRNPRQVAYFCSPIEKIKAALEHNMRSKGTINIYYKTGKKVLASFEG